MRLVTIFCGVALLMSGLSYASVIWAINFEAHPVEPYDTSITNDLGFPYDFILTSYDSRSVPVDDIRVSLPVGAEDSPCPERKEYAGGSAFIVDSSNLQGYAYVKQLDNDGGVFVDDGVSVDLLIGTAANVPDEVKSLKPYGTLHIRYVSPVAMGWNNEHECLEYLDEHAKIIVSK